jgi:hypothetical protein
MIAKADMPKAEAHVIVHTLNRDDWRPVVEMDPIMVPVDQVGPGQVADVFDADLLGLVDGICALDAAFSEGETTAMLEYLLVWSANGQPVKGVCPGCDDVFIVSGGIPGDMLNEGYDAVCCGCNTP